MAPQRPSHVRTPTSALTPRRALVGLALLLGAPSALGQQLVLPLAGDGPGQVLGWSVGGAGDVDGDGRADVVVGIVRDGTNGVDAGAARVHSGADGAVLFTFLGDAPSDFFGHSVAGAGDVDGDGTPDLIVGAPNHDGVAQDSGRARVFSGRSGAVLFTFEGHAPGALCGFSVAGAGDVDADGRADLIVGSPGWAGGRARVYSGLDGAALHTFDGAAPLALQGASVAGAGDVDGDGHADLIVGAPRELGQRGRARVYSGLDGQLLHLFEGEELGDWLGNSVAGAGDVDRDGVPDLIVGAPFDDPGGDDSGSARIHSGATGLLLAFVAGDDPFDRLGWAVAGAGDVDGDGHPDVVVGAPEDDDNGTRCGAARIVSGRTGAPLFTFFGDNALDSLGLAVAGAGDVNGDGYAEVVLGAPDDDPNGGQSGSALVQSLFAADAPGVAYCFGLGCPCGNPDPQAGCGNSTGAGGLLATQGSNRLSVGDLGALASQLPPGATALLVAGTETAAAPFGDGKRCVGGVELRAGARAADGAGRARWGPGLADELGLAPGDVRHLQVRYRDGRTGPCGTGFNATHALTLAVLE